MKSAPAFFLDRLSTLLNFPTIHEIPNVPYFLKMPVASSG
jgi:hypothetical protein